MDKPNGSEVARTEVTQFIISYIKTNNLQWQENRKIIKCNYGDWFYLDAANDESPRVHRRPVCLSQATLPDSFKLS